MSRRWRLILQVHVCNIFKHEFIVQICNVSELFPVRSYHIHQPADNSTQVLNFSLLGVQYLHLLDLVLVVFLQKGTHSLTFTVSLIN